MEYACQLKAGWSAWGVVGAAMSERFDCRHRNRMEIWRCITWRIYVPCIEIVDVLFCRLGLRFVGMLTRTVVAELVTERLTLVEFQIASVVVVVDVP